MPNAQKISAVEEIADRFRGSTASVLTEYRGLSTAQLTELRRTLGRQTTYAIVKNTLAKRAAASAGFDLEVLLSGPTAVAFIDGDAVDAAKGLRDFAKANPSLVIKGGILDGRPLSAEEVNQIADLESREVVLSKIAGAMTAKMGQMASLFQETLSEFARLVEALEAKKPAVDAPSDATDGQSTDAATTTEPANAEPAGSTTS